MKKYLNPPQYEGNFNEDNFSLKELEANQKKIIENNISKMKNVLI